MRAYWWLVAWCFLIAVLSGCSIVGPQDRGIRIRAGEATGVLEPGAHLWFPVLFGVAKLDLSIQKSDIETSAASKDMQEVTTHVAVNWQLDAGQALKLYQTIGDEDAALNRIVIPAVNEVLKSATAKKTAEEILTKRMELKAEIDEALKVRLATYGLRFVDANIVNLHFSPQFTAAIESKQIAEQQSKQAAYVADKAKREAEASVNRARGEAEAQRMQKATITAELLQLKAIEKWDGKLPDYLGAGPLPFLNVRGGK